MNHTDRIAAAIDHTILRADASTEAVRAVCEECRRYGFAMIAVNSAQVPLCHRELEGCSTHVGAAVGFPLGQTRREVKAFETRLAIREGADEIDYVADLTQVKDGRWDRVREEMAQLTDICREKGRIIKVIFENCYLTADEIRRLGEIAREVEPDFVKTSTGFGTGGARVEDVALMKEAAGPRVAVKAAGGIRTLDSLLAMEAAGATRFGTSAGVAILEEARIRFGGEAR